jgi:hypothetical protein
LDSGFAKLGMVRTRPQRFGSLHFGHSGSGRHFGGFRALCIDLEDQTSEEVWPTFWRLWTAFPAIRKITFRPTQMRTKLQHISSAGAAIWRTTLPRVRTSLTPIWRAKLCSTRLRTAFHRMPTALAQFQPFRSVAIRINPALDGLF